MGRPGDPSCHAGPIIDLTGLTLATVLVVCVAGILPARAEGIPPSEELEQTLASVQECVARSPAPWAQEWRSEYVATIRAAIVSHPDAAQYAKRLQILREGFGSYWETIRKSGERSLFEVHRAEIRWYVENLMSVYLPGEKETRMLRHQYEDLADHAAQSLLGQFSFLDPNLVQRAKTDHFADCYRNIDAPLLPIFLTSLSETQVEQIKQRWHDLRYARVDLWRQLGGSTRLRANDPNASSVQTHSDYLLAQRSLAQLRPHIWAVAAPSPDYYRMAVTNELREQRRRVQTRSEARRREMQMGNAVLQTEYVSFLLGALLETAESYQKEAQ